jgi:hypothetical protein
VQQLRRRAAERSQHHREETLGLPHAVIAGREQIVDLDVGELGPRQQAAQLGLGEVGVRDRHHSLALAARRAQQLGHIQIGHEQRPLELQLALDQVVNAERATHDASRQLRVCLAQPDLHAPARSGDIAGAPLCGRTQLCEDGGRDVVGQHPIGRQPLAEQDEGVHRLGHLAPQQRVEDVDGDRVQAAIGKRLESRREALVHYVGRARSQLLGGDAVARPADAGAGGRRPGGGAAFGHGPAGR